VRIERAPAGLKARGGGLWRAVVAAFELRDGDELAVLAAACRTADEIAAFEAVLAESPAMLPGSKGQLRPHPLIGEVRQHRLALGRLLAQLALADANAVSGGLARSAAGRKLASARWQRKAG
jgi:hypothetical protein